MARLSKITLRGFKSIRALEDFELRPINVLIGENGSGKSNFVSFFRFLNAMTQSPGNLQMFINTRGFGSSFLFYGPKRTTQLEASLDFSEGDEHEEYMFCLQHVSPDTLIFLDEKYRIRESEQDADQWTQLGGGETESRMLNLSDRGEVSSRRIISRFRKIGVYHFLDTSSTSRIRLACSSTDNHSLKKDGGNLAAMLFRLKEEEPQYYHRIVEIIRMATSYFEDFILEPNISGKLLLQWKENGADEIFGPHQASDGTLRMMALFTLLQLPHRNLPDLLILDEPELGLHPYAMEMLASMIQSLSLSKQIILTTQSTYLLDHFAPEDVVVVNRVEGESTFKRCSEEELKGWLERYTMSELWEKNVIQGTP